VPAIFGPEAKAYREWPDASALGSLGGSLNAADIASYHVTPYELGYGRTIRFDHDFLGRDALERIADGPHRDKVTLVWHADDVAAAVRSLCEPGQAAKFIEWPKARYAFFQVDQVLSGGQLAVGRTAELAKPAVEPHRQVEIRATVAPAPYVAEVRAAYRSS
jgi:hypothetical protein